MNLDCSVCHGARWVCENHPDRPWDTPDGCRCGGAGMPCETCNPCDHEHPPQMPEGWVAFEPGDEPSL